MPFSQNGFSANDRSLIATYTVPGTDGRVAIRKGDVATVLLYVLGRFNKEVERLVWPGVWGYAERTIRGSSTTLSNHASGTAVDANAPAHPLGTNPYSNYSPTQIAAIHRILSACYVSGRRVVRWGGDYTGRKDGMHFEIVGSAADVAALARRLRGVPLPPAPASSVLKVGSRGPRVSRIQRIVRVTADGIFGPKTEAAVKRWQSAHHVTADGIWGPNTEAAYKKSLEKPKYSGWLTGYVKRGSRGAPVKRVQELVGVAQDGIFGPKTEYRVKAWQRAHGLVADGICGPDFCKAANWHWIK